MFGRATIRLGIGPHSSLQSIPVFVVIKSAKMYTGATTDNIE